MALFILFFYLLLPSLNALADLVSVAFTRWFLRRIAGGTQGWPVIALELALDLAVALATLIGLVFLIALGLDLWAKLGAPPFDWRAYRAEILGGNPGEGTLLYGMAFTTLVPTLAHVWAGSAALFTYRAAGYRRASEKLEALAKSVPEGAAIPIDIARQDLAEIIALIRRSQRFGWIKAIGAVALVLIAAAALLWGLAQLWPSMQAFPIP